MFHLARLTACFLAGALAVPAQGWAQGGHSAHGAISGGAPGDPGKVRRTIEIVATDNVFSLKSLRVAAGETIRFVIRNKGELLHEFSIGDAHMHQMHQEEMDRLMQAGAITTVGIDAEKMPHAGHAHGNSVLVEPGKSAALVWRFAKDGTIEFACNIPGHYQAGMRGPIQVQ